MYLYMNKGFIYFIYSFILLSIAFIYFYRKKDQLCSTLSAVAMGITCTLVIVKWLDQFFSKSEVFGLFIIAVIIFAWFALITVLLIKLIPKSRFNNIPLAVGAWIAGIIMSLVMLTFWGNFSLIMGIVFIAFASYILKIKQNLFLRQLAYCLFVAGQFAILFHTYELTDEVYPLLLIQIIALFLAYWIRTHWCFIFLQLLALYIVSAVLILDIKGQGHWINYYTNLIYLPIVNYIFFLAMIWIKNIQPVQYQRSLMLTVLSIFLFTAKTNSLLHADEILKIQYVPILTYGLPILWFVLFGYLRIRSQFHILAKLMLIIFAAVLIFFEFFEIFICMAVISWALNRHDKVVYTVGLMVFALILWRIYYNLEVSFLLKSLSIFTSGIVLLLMTFCLNKFKQQGEI